MISSHLHPIFTPPKTRFNYFFIYSYPITLNLIESFSKLFQAYNLARTPPKNIIDLWFPKIKNNFVAVASLIYNAGVFCRYLRWLLVYRYFMFSKLQGFMAKQQKQRKHIQQTQKLIIVIKHCYCCLILTWIMRGSNLIIISWWERCAAGYFV